MKTKNQNIKVGFELEVMFSADSYPELEDLCIEKGFDWEDNDGQAPYFIRKFIADELSNFIDKKVSARTNSKRSPTKVWAIKEEYSIENLMYDAICAVEVVTQPLPVEEALQELASLFDFCHINGGFTSHDCGLHITVDSPNDFTPLNVALTLNERKLASAFGRENNDCVAPQKEKIISEIIVALSEGNKQALSPPFLRHVMGVGKGFGLNIEKLTTFGLLEFRYCGGKNVLDNFETVADTVHQIINAIELPLDLDATIKNDIEGHALKGLSIYSNIKTKEQNTRSFPSLAFYYNNNLIGEAIQYTATDFCFNPVSNKRFPQNISVDSIPKVKALAALSALEYID